MDGVAHSRHRALHAMTAINFGLHAAGHGHLVRHGSPGQVSMYPRTAINYGQAQNLPLPTPDSGSRCLIPGSRFLVLGSWFSVLSSQFLVLSSRFLVLGSQFPVLGSRFSVPGSWFSVLGSWSSVLGSRFLVLGSWFSVLGSRFSVLGSPLPRRHICAAEERLTIERRLAFRRAGAHI